MHVFHIKLIERSEQLVVISHLELRVIRGNNYGSTLLMVHGLINNLKLLATGEESVSPGISGTPFLGCETVKIISRTTTQWPWRALSNRYQLTISLPILRRLVFFIEEIQSCLPMCEDLSIEILYDILDKIGERLITPLCVTVRDTKLLLTGDRSEQTSFPSSSSSKALTDAETWLQPSFGLHVPTASPRPS